MNNQYLPVAMAAGTDADGWNAQTFTYLLRQGSGYFFQHNAETSQFL